MTNKKRLTIGCVIGTRPELIKMAAIIHQLKASDWAEVLIINTAQHRHLLDDMLDLFELHPDIDLDCMTENQSLGQLTGILCHKLDQLFNQHSIDALLAVGDTTTVMVCSLIAFYHRIPFGHIESGLRTYNRHEPFPEEINRVLTAPLATWHFAPTLAEQENLRRENIPADNILVTGNPVIDALYWILKHKPAHDILSECSEIIVVTAHRRENIGRNLQNISQAILTLSEKFPAIHFVLPVHPNPNVQKTILSVLGNHAHIHLLAPLKYDQFAHLMNRATLIMTDSGGIQEEAPALGKPVVVLRNTTERPAVISAGVGILAGTDPARIVDIVSQLLTDKKLYASMSQGLSPYGDGHAAQRITAYLKQSLYC
ncbi:non-hydrolyzing UDP-N-acetylglucosamine 2-epimerase [Legionella dresdenensis]|uniref:UDP-N-acetylglucosamine 2-epimerase (non-hydrolyzing) n=1 Tax=Legionella dresdenensis TaxID=450200 RepID=A0ABV8CIW8_9GAMM